jgi:hypothetical protein
MTIVESAARSSGAWSNLVVQNDPNRTDHSASQSGDRTCLRRLLRLVEFRSARPPVCSATRRARADSHVFLYAFDLIELNGDDLRREPLEVRKATLASVLAKAELGLRLNEHLEHDDGEVVFRHDCKMGLASSPSGSARLIVRADRGIG